MKKLISLTPFSLTNGKCQHNFFLLLFSLTHGKKKENKAKRMCFRSKYDFFDLIILKLNLKNNLKLKYHIKKGGRKSKRQGLRPPSVTPPSSRKAGDGEGWLVKSVVGEG